jgi:hypothetical protein
VFSKFTNNRIGVAYPLAKPDDIFSVASLQDRCPQNELSYKPGRVPIEIASVGDNGAGSLKVIANTFVNAAAEIGPISNTIHTALTQIKNAQSGVTSSVSSVASQAINIYNPNQLSGILTTVNNNLVNAFNTMNGLSANIATLGMNLQQGSTQCDLSGINSAAGSLNPNIQGLTSTVSMLLTTLSKY